MKMFSTATSYLTALAGTVALLLALTFLFNALVDPLWYFAGNGITKVNFAFNERFSKTNRFINNREGYDCAILGDSRVTLLPEHLIGGYRCYNFAFSAGTAFEAVEYAHWLNAYGFKPKLVIVGVSGSDFRADRTGRVVPDFVLKRTAPPSPFLEYLSFDVLKMSLRTLFGRPPLDRVYDAEFQCRVAPTVRKYDPHAPVKDLTRGALDDRQSLSAYRELKEIFPDAQLVGYAPPFSAWAIAEYERIGWLASYTRALHDAAQVFDRFVDYSVPSAMTTDPAATYDGTHYSEAANETVARTLIDGSPGEALDLKAMSEEEMLAAYRARLALYGETLTRALAGKPRPVPSAVPHAQSPE